MPIVWSVMVLVVMSVFWLLNTSRAATETPVYQVVRADGAFEVRDYPALTLATTPMKGADMNGSFGHLFRFITGRNEGEQKISMTTPVLIDGAADKQTMSFIMPKATVEKGVPQPTGDQVTLGQVAATRVAVMRFAGGRSVKNEQAAITKLKAWLTAQKLVGKGDPRFAYYDPPWTPIFLRRNEVMIRL